MADTTALLTAFGFGAIVAAIVAFGSNRFATIAGLRQKWIDALRDDIALYMKKIDIAFHKLRRVPQGKLEEYSNPQVIEFRDARDEALEVLNRLLLRLNSNERLHRDLEAVLKGPLDLLGGYAITVEAKRRIITISRRVLRREWARVKFGFAAEYRLTQKARTLRDEQRQARQKRAASAA